MPISALPPSPSRLDAPDVFSDKADAFLGALPAFVTQANALQTDVNSKQSAAATSATTATNAAQAINSALNRYTFSTTTTMADPGVGVIRFNNAAAASATAIAIDAQSADTGNPNILNLLLSFGDSTNNPKGLIRFTQAGTPDNYRAYNVTAVTNNTGWVQFTVTHVAGAGSFSNGASLVMEFHRAGNAGDVQLSANNTFTGNNSFNNTTVVSANSSSDALRITQTGSGNALVVEDSASPDSTPLVVDAGGNLVVGATTNAGQKFRVVGPASVEGLFSVNLPADYWTSSGISTTSSGEGGLLGTNGNYRPSWMCNGYRNTSGTWTSLGLGGATGAAAIEMDPVGAVYFYADEVKASGSAMLPTRRMRIDGNGSIQNVTIPSGTSAYGFGVTSSFIGATNNYGFFSDIPAGAGRWNFYANGTAANYFGGPFAFKPGSSATPANNGDLTFEATSNTSVTIKLRGSDGVVRSAVITLS